MTDRGRRRVAFSLMAAVAFTAAAGLAQPAGAQPPTTVRLLDVPYLPQSVALCGGAAAAMVMRYWGEAAIYPEAFADLVIPEEGGIRGADLLEALRARGWDAHSFRGDGPFIQKQLAGRRPVVALIEDRPGTYHYVVIVGWTGGRVIAHDPARAPFRVLDEAAFVAAWERANFWSMLALPPASITAPDARPSSSGSPGTDRGPCDAMVDEGVRLAHDGDTGASRRVLESAAETCPSSSAPWRELAGLHVLGDDWDAAARDARRAVDRDRRDEHAWRILATSLFLKGRSDEALEAWNAVGEPAVDLVNVRGLDRTRFAVALATIGLEPQAPLTSRALVRARRRLGEMPSVQAARVTYRPLENGQAVVDAAVIERHLVPAGLTGLAATGLRMASDRELRVEIASPSGGGERWRGAWRWWRHRPGASVEFSAPGPRGGVRHVTLFTEKATFGSAGHRQTERRSGGHASVADWTLGGLRWEAGAGLESWEARGQAGVVFVDAVQRLGDDRLEIHGRITARAGRLQAATGELSARWASSRVHERRVLLARAGVESATGASPQSLWPGAGIGQAREPLLRAHPLLSGGVLDRGVFGRSLVHGGVEWRQWHTMGRGLVRAGPALFVDTARAWRTIAPFDERWHADAGAGIRVALPGAGVARIDLARGVRDGRMVLSVGWVR